jgi:hypothetical protein
MRTIVTALAMLVTASAANAQADIDTANYMLPYCKQFVNPPVDHVPSAMEALSIGFCAGMVSGIGFSDARDICTPGEAMLNQMVGVVVAYIEAHPARVHENFKLLAAEALRSAWPCH